MFTGSLGLAVESVVNHYETNGGIQEGDVLVVNDPFITGTHQWDVAVIVPELPRRGDRGVRGDQGPSP